MSMPKEEIIGMVLKVYDAEVKPLTDKKKENSV